MKLISRGFTLVELVIVIGVLGILSSIVLFGWGAAIENSNTSSRASEMELWRKSFELYKSRFATYPEMPDGSYCLGTGFPNAKCGLFSGSDPAFTATEAASVPLMNQIKRVSPSIPKITVPPAKTWIGPYADYTSTTIEITGVFLSSSCPTGTTLAFSDAGRNHCSYILTR